METLLVVLVLSHVYTASWWDRLTVRVMIGIQVIEV